jgi:glyoxylase-like metal-dependent hydrolase (beta-lactamase superfamily II)
MEIHTFPLGPLETNCYLVSNGDRAVAVDPGGDPAAVVRHLENNGLTLETVVLTHLHCDHLYGVQALAEATGAPVLASEKDRSLMDTEIGGGGLMGLPRVAPFEFQDLPPGERELAGLPCTVLPTPGHSGGSVSLYFPDRGAVLVGDLLFYRSIGRTDFPGGDLQTLQQSVKERIFTLPEDTEVYPGHGPTTRVGDEKRNNPFFTDYGF